MNILESKKVEDCFDGSSILEYKIHKTISKDFIEILGSLGKLEYYDEFPIPYFKVKIDNGSEIRGLLGEDTFRITYCNKCKDTYKPFFEDFVAKNLEE